MINKELIKIEMKEINDKLKHWAKAYYDNNKSLVSDTTYDAELRKLTLLEAQFPELTLEDSMTKQVGGKVSKKFAKVEHEFPMLSLDNAFNEEDLIRFDKHIKTTLGTSQENEYIGEYKIDGLSISIIYKNGLLNKAITRGDGKVGEDVTLNIIKIKNLPKRIDYQNDLVVRGEVFFKHKDFLKLNEDEDQYFANPRNAAAGTLRQLDSEVVEQRNLSVYLYAIPNPLDHNLSSQFEVLNFLRKHNFPVYEKTFIFNSIFETIEWVKKADDVKSTLDFDIDGLVIKLNNVKLYEDVGYTVKFPKFMTAYKLKEEVAYTELLDIFPTVGRTGRITYNAKLKPIELGKTTVEAATLHNAEYVLENEINIGDIVEVKKAGEIIPKVLGVYEKRNKDIWQEHTICPSCKSILVRFDGEVDQYCTNPNCDDKVIASLEHFVSKKAMNIEGLSTEQLKFFYKDKKWIKSPADIFILKSFKDELLQEHGYKEKSVNKLLNSIEEAKNRDLHRFIFALGIRHIGEKMSKTLTKRFQTIYDFKNLDASKLEGIRDIGSKVIESLLNYFNDEKNWKYIDNLIANGVNLLKPANNNESFIFDGMTFVITGTLSKSRDHFVKMIEMNGGNVSNSVSSRTNYLLCGEEAGSKKEKAEKLKVKIIGENEFLELLNKNNI